jgi:hypothetical protein
MKKAEITKARKGESTKGNSSLVLSPFRVFVILRTKPCKP